MIPELDPQAIEAAHREISPWLVDTPLTWSSTLSDICGCQALFKLENLQMTGSFKERGALNRLLSLSDEERRQGVIAASAGNHAQAVAYHGNRLGISTRIVMPRYSPLVKIRSTEHWHAEVILEGDTFDDAYAWSQQVVEQENRVYIHPFDDPLVAQGQGTLAIDVLNHELAKDLDAILVPVGGGGLIAGITAYIKRVKPEVRIIGVEETSCDAMTASKRAGKVVVHESEPVIADGIAVRCVSPRNLEIVSKYVDDMVAVTSDEIANAIMLMLEIEKMVIEGAAAVTLAALVNRKLPALLGKKVVSLITGGNIDVNLLSKIINRGLTFDGRIARLDSVIRDRPGALEKLLGVFREAGANILEVNHHRFSSDTPIGEIGVSVTMETHDQEHIDHIRAMLAERGYSVRAETGQQ